MNSSPAFGLRIPGSWTTYDLSGDGLAAIRAGLLRATTDPTAREEINASYRIARHIMDSARGRGAVYAPSKQRSSAHPHTPARRISAPTPKQWPTYSSQASR